MIGIVTKGNDEQLIVEAASFDFLTLVLVLFSIVMWVWFVRSNRKSVPRRGYLDPAITPTLAIMLCFVMLLLGGIGAWWGASQAPDGTMASSAWMYGASMVAQIPVVFAYGYLRRRCGSRHILPVSVASFVVFVPMAFAVSGVAHLVFTRVGWEPHTDLGHTTLQELASSPWGMSAWIVILCATIGAGVVEEIVYRGLVLPSLTAVMGGKTVWRAMIATSVIFSLMHIGTAQPSAILGLFVFSIGLCWARVKSGGVIAPILIHTIFNAMNIAFVYSTSV